MSIDNTNIVNRSINSNSSIQHFLKINNYAINESLQIDAINSRITNVSDNADLGSIVTLENSDNTLLDSQFIQISSSNNIAYSAETTLSNFISRINIDNNTNDTYPSTKEQIQFTKELATDDFLFNTSIKNETGAGVTGSTRVFNTWQDGNPIGFNGSTNFGLIENNDRIIGISFEGLFYSDDAENFILSNSSPDVQLEIFSLLGGNSNGVILAMNFGPGPFAKSTDNGLSFVTSPNPNF